MARTDALAVVGLDEVIERAVLCEQAEPTRYLRRR